MYFYLDLHSFSHRDINHLREFLRYREIKNDISDADIMAIELDDEVSLFNMGMQFSMWLYCNRNDMTINRNGDGSKYHVRG